MSLKCARCAKEAPNNVSVFPSKTGALWFCDGCDQNHLIDELTSIYNSGTQGRFLYISDFTNNLDKVNNHFKENVDLSNPSCTIILVSPEGIDKVDGVFDGIFLEQDSATQGQLARLFVTPEAFIKIVHPTTQTII